MLKTIKTTKQLRLDELIKYIFEEKIKGEGDYGLINFHSDADTDVEVNSCGQVSVHGFYSGNELFPIETEEEITEDTVFDNLITVERDDMTYYEYKRSIGFILSKTSDVVQILASVNGKYRTVWERDNQ